MNNDHAGLNNHDNHLILKATLLQRKNPFEEKKENKQTVIYIKAHHLNTNPSWQLPIKEIIQPLKTNSSM
jgi:hypothetical protein